VCTDEGDLAAEESQRGRGDAVGAALDLLGAAPWPHLRRIARHEVGNASCLFVQHSGECLQVAWGKQRERSE
jgi:hypothetical protein